jgi:hypothetical protein
MRRPATLGVTLVLAAGLSVVSLRVVRAQARAADEAAIRAHIESIFQAFIDKDRDKLAATHGKNWRGYLSYSDTVIKGRDNYVRASVGDGPMEPKGQGMIGYKILEYDTVWYGDVAVVNFVADVHYKWGPEPHTSKLTLMDIYAKEDGGWIQVASQTSLHPEYQQRRMSDLQQLWDDDRKALLEAREAVWRAWYGGDIKALKELLPPELITLTPEGWGNYDVIIAASAEYAKGGGKLVRLQFPRTDMQSYGNTAIIYTSYELDLNEGGKARTERGKATEIFVRRSGKWLNTGWQLAPDTTRAQAY